MTVWNIWFFVVCSASQMTTTFWLVCKFLACLLLRSLGQKPQLWEPGFCLISIQCKHALKYPSQLLEKIWNYGDLNGQEDLSSGLGVGTGIEHLFSLVAVGKSTPTKAHLLSPCPWSPVSIPNRCLGKIPCLFQVHFFLTVPHPYSGLLIWSLTSPWRKNG